MKPYEKYFSKTPPVAGPVGEMRKCIHGPPAPSSMNRWSKEGLLGEVLEVYYVGCRPYVTRDALFDFLDKVDRIQSGNPEEPGPSPQDTANQEAEELGI